MAANNYTDDEGSAPKKQKCISDISLLNLFVDYLAEQEPATRTPQEIIECAQVLRRKTTGQLTQFQSVVRKKLNRLLPILLECKEDVNFVDKRGQTVLHIFILHYTDERIFRQIDASRDKKTVGSLLEKGASVDVVDATGNTPVHHAASNQRYDLVQSMLENFTNVNSANGCGLTVLDILVHDYYERPSDILIEVIRSLVSKGADYSRKPAKDYATSPLDFAVAHGLIKILEIFKANGANSENLLLRISKLMRHGSKHSEELQHLDRLVNLAESVNSQIDEHRFTPLHYVSQFGRLDAVELFVNAGAEIDAKTVDGVTPLHLAVMEGHLDIAKFLIGRGADLRARDRVFDFGLMHMATFNVNGNQSNQDLIGYLVAQGLDVEDESKDGFRPLHCAAMMGRDWTIKVLIHHGVDANSRVGDEQLTALHLLANRHKDSVLQNVVEKYYGPNQLTVRRNARRNAMRNARLDNRVVDFDFRPINFAAMREEANRQYSLVHRNLRSNLKVPADAIEAAIIRLLQVGAAIDARDAELRTPLHHALSVRIGNGDDVSTVVLTLLRHGARVDVHDAARLSPLVVLHDNSMSNDGLAELIAYGADIDEVRTEPELGHTSFESYTLRRHVELVRALGLPITDEHRRFFLEVNEEPWRALRNNRSDERQENIDGEIAKMKTHRLADGQTSLYDFLHMDAERRCAFAEDVLSRDLTREFPIFRIVVENRCRGAINKKLIFNLASAALYRIARFQFPDVCLKMIFGFMSLPEMTAFIDAVESFDL